MSSDFGFWLIAGGAALILLAVALWSSDRERPFVKRRPF